MHRTQPDGDPARDRKRAADFLQGQVGLPGNHLQHLRAVLAQPAATVAAHRARARMALGPPALRPASSAADTDVKPCRRLPYATAQRHETNHTLPQILRVRSRHIASNSMVQPQPRQSAKTRKPLSLRVYLIGIRSSTTAGFRRKYVVSNGFFGPAVGGGGAS